MKFRKLQINVRTPEGPFGASINFPDGLVVVWADNSMGKSTCVRSILIALGMEAMLTYSRTELPLPPAVMARLESDQGELTVLESEVWLEIENSSGQRIVTQRTLKGQKNKNLITVYNGPVLTQANLVVTSNDYFVNLQGGATREHGFHYFLTQFLGWKLPVVQSFDGSERPLYLQCIFPYFVVEQTRGWSTLQPPIPTHFRIRDVHKRAVEFILDLDAHSVALKRQELKLEKSRIESEWKLKVSQTTDIAEMAGGTIQAMPRQPVVSWPPQVPPQLMVPVAQTWVPLTVRLQARKNELSKLVKLEIPRVEEIASTAQAELDVAEREAREKQTLLSRLLDVLESEKEEIQRVEHRVITIAEDIQRHRDVKTLQGLGSRQGSQLDAGNCPVCHQSVQDSLLPLDSSQVVMSLDENIEFLNEQKRTFELVLRNAKRAFEARAVQCQTINNELSSLRDRVRSLRQTLVTDGRLPSLAAIRTRIELENAIKFDELHLTQFTRSVAMFEDLAAQWLRCQSELAALPRDDSTVSDHRKIKTWTTVLRNQLTQYGFRSFSPLQISISTDTYRPEHEGFDLQSNPSSAEATGNSVLTTTTQLQNSISASDLIRTIWAYLQGLLEMGRSEATNHPGFILFDEPRQQSTRDISFSELLQRSSSSIEFGQQVIFFTSENLERLRGHLAGLPHSLVAIDGRVIKPLTLTRRTHGSDKIGEM